MWVWVLVAAGSFPLPNPGPTKVVLLLRACCLTLRLDDFMPGPGKSVDEGIVTRAHHVADLHPQSLRPLRREDVLKDVDDEG